MKLTQQSEADEHNIYYIFDDKGGQRGVQKNPGGMLGLISASHSRVAHIEEDGKPVFIREKTLSEEQRLSIDKLHLWPTHEEDKIDDGTEAMAEAETRTSASSSDESATETRLSVLSDIQKASFEFDQLVRISKMLLKKDSIALEYTRGLRAELSEGQLQQNFIEALKENARMYRICYQNFYCAYFTLFLLNSLLCS